MYAFQRTKRTFNRNISITSDFIRFLLVYYKIKPHIL